MVHEIDSLTLGIVIGLFIGCPLGFLMFTIVRTGRDDD